MKNKRTIISIFILVLLLVIAQVLFPILGHGPKNFYTVKAPGLQVPQKMAQSYQSSSYVGAVGGVTFDTQASPASGYDVTSLDLNYNPLADDGNRLQVNINGQDLYASIYDWELMPIINFVNSNNYSLFTLFGDADDSAFTDAFYQGKIDSLLDKSDWIVNYHPQLQNTLLGLRLFQMDMLILYPFNSDLPKDDDEYVLGAGESAPNLTANETGFDDFRAYFNGVISDQGFNYRSYILSDFTRDIQFSARNDSLIIPQLPYYYFWRYRFDEASYDQDAALDSIVTALEDEWLYAQDQDPNVNIRNWLIDQLLFTIDEYLQLHDIFTGGTLYDIIHLPTEAEKRQEIEFYDNETIYIDFLLTMKFYMDQYRVNYLVDYSEQMSAHPEMLRAINPAVWDATVKTMRYAAFFRYCQEQFPVQWQQFLNRVEDVIFEPYLVTPTLMYDEGSTYIAQLLADYSNQAPVLSDIPMITLKKEETYKLDLNPYVTDDDHSDGSITWSAIVNSDSTLGKVSIVNCGSLKPMSGKITNNRLYKNTATRKNQAIDYAYLQNLQPKINLAENDFALKIVIDNYSKTSYFTANTDLAMSELFNVLFVGTDPGGLSDTCRLQVLATDIEQDESPVLPAAYSLAQNYPNPFNPNTTIQFTLPQAGQVELAVFNCNGQLVNRLVHANFAAGMHNVQWNGVDHVGNPVSSGVYYYRLTIFHDGQRDMLLNKKMILIK